MEVDSNMELTLVLSWQNPEQRSEPLVSDPLSFRLFISVQFFLQLKFFDLFRNVKPLIKSS